VHYISFFLSPSLILYVTGPHLLSTSHGPVQDSSNFPNIPGAGSNPSPLTNSLITEPLSYYSFLRSPATFLFSSYLKQSTLSAISSHQRSTSILFSSFSSNYPQYNSSSGECKFILCIRSNGENHVVELVWHTMLMVLA